MRIYRHIHTHRTARPRASHPDGGNVRLTCSRGVSETVVGRITSTYFACESRPKEREKNVFFFCLAYTIHAQVKIRLSDRLYLYTACMNSLAFIAY